MSDTPGFATKRPGMKFVTYVDDGTKLTLSPNGKCVYVRCKETDKILMAIGKDRVIAKPVE